MVLVAGVQKAATVLVTDGRQIYALLHAEDTVLAVAADKRQKLGMRERHAMPVSRRHVGLQHQRFRVDQCAVEVENNGYADLLAEVQ